MLINIREGSELKKNYSKAFIDNSNDIGDIYENTEEYNPNKQGKMLIVFYDTIADMLSNKNLNPIGTELFIRGGKLNISLVFMTQFYFTAPKNIRLNSRQYFIRRIPQKRELQEIAFNHSTDIYYKDYRSLQKYTSKPYSFFSD